MFGDNGDGSEESVRQGLSSLEKYKRRKEELEHTTYLQFLLRYNFQSAANTHELREGTKNRVLNYFPEYKREHPDQEEHYCRVKLMLHRPFREIEGLKLVEAVNGQPWETFKDAYASCQLTHVHEPDYYDIPEPPEPEGPVEDEPRANDEGIRQAWMDMAGHLPQRDGTRVEDPDDLGERDLDREYDWDCHVGRHPDLSDEFWKLMKTEHPATLNGVHSSATVEGLEDKQRQLYDLIVGHYERLLRGEIPEQLLINLDGKAGTGKSHVIMFISSVLEKMASDAGRECPIIRAAPTGVAAYGISGRTLHALFRFPVGKSGVSHDQLNAQNLQALQATFRGVSYLIIDEKSMIGLQQLAAIDRRCRDIFPHKRDEPFGGLNVVLAGDVFQLPAVAQKALFWDGRSKNEFEIQAQLRYRDFDTTIELDVVRRQEGTDPIAQRFKQALDHLREDALTYEDWELLASRVQSQVPADLPRFKDAIHIYSRKEEVREYNFVSLRDSKKPVIKINALHHGLRAAEASTEDAGNLQAILLLSIGSRIMLMENLWTERGLVNGAFGTIHDIIWKEGDGEVRHRAPFALLVKFDGYTGPGFLRTENDDILVPIFMSTREFFRGNVSCTRTQFPMALAYAITIHKAQGITVPRTVLNIAARDFAPGLTYVAVSRVKTLDGVLFEESFDFDRFRRRPSDLAKMRQADLDRRRRQHVSAPFPLDLNTPLT